MFPYFDSLLFTSFPLCTNVLVFLVLSIYKFVFCPGVLLDSLPVPVVLAAGHPARAQLLEVVHRTILPLRHRKVYQARDLSIQLDQDFCKAMCILLGNLKIQTTMKNGKTGKTNMVTFGQNCL